MHFLLSYGNFQRVRVSVCMCAGQSKCSGIEKNDLSKRTIALIEHSSICLSSCIISGYKASDVHISVPCLQRSLILSGRSAFHP